MIEEEGQKPGVAWHLRTPEGTVYGPAKVDALRHWAEQGRIGPGCHVSSDGTDWMPAKSLKALDLSWQVDMGQDTFYGPLNLAAVRALVSDGTIAAEAPIIHTITRERTTVQQKLDEWPASSGPRKPQQDDTLQEHNRELAARVEKLEEDARAYKEVIHKKKQLVEELGRVRKSETRLRKQVAQLQGALENTTARAVEIDKQLKNERAQREHGEQELLKKGKALDDALRKLRKRDLHLKEMADARAADVTGWRRKVRQLTEDQIRQLEDVSRLIEKHLGGARRELAECEDAAELPGRHAAEIAVEHIAPHAVRSQPAPAAPLQRLEAQAQHELEAWVSARRRATRKMQDAEHDADSSIPPRRVFDL